MGSDAGLMLTMLCYAVVAAAALSIAGPQTLRLVRMRRVADGLGLFRLKNALVYGALFLLATRTLLVWADFVVFDQRYLGPVEHRWGFDLAVAAIAALAVAFAAALHWKTSHEAPA